MVGTRGLSKLECWASENPSAHVGSFADAAAFAEVVVLAVKGTAASSALHLATPENLAGKSVIDATNPIADLPPVNGVLQFSRDSTSRSWKDSNESSPRLTS